MSLRLYVITAGLRDPSGADVTLQAASGRGFIAKASDGLLDPVFEPRLIQPLVVRRSLHGSGRTWGRSDIVAGEMIFNNADGGLDQYLDHGFDGGELIQYVAEVETLAEVSFPSSFTEVFRGTMEQPEWSSMVMRLCVRDRKYQLLQTVQGETYAGDNVLPAGLEGTPEDIGGKYKPLRWGNCFNETPELVNSSRLIYQIHAGLLHDVTNVWVNRVPLVKGSAYADQTDMETNAPNSGEFRYRLDGGYIRLESAPNGSVTTDSVEGADAAARTVGQIARRILEYTDVGSLEIAGDDVLDTFNAAEAGMPISGGTARSAAGVLDELLATIGAYWGESPSGGIVFGVVDAPAGTPVESFTEDDIISLTRRSTSDPGSGVPCWRVLLRYQKNGTVQTGDDLAAGTATPEAAAWAGQAYRTVVTEDATVKDVHRSAPELEITTLFATKVDAQAEADRLLALRGTRRDMYDLRVAFSYTSPQAVQLGDVVEITYDRFGLDNGQLFLVVSVEYDVSGQFIELGLWG